MLLAVALALSASSVHAQLYEKKVVEYVRKIAGGETERVAGELPQMRQKLPHSAGLIYVEGLIAANETEAIRCFRVIADSFPRSEWADDALARLFEVYSLSGSPDEAGASVNRLRSQYPQSPYLATSYLTDVHPAKARDDSDVAVPNGEFAVQVGAFTRKENAARLTKKFEADGWSVDLFENLLDGKNLFYLVWIGSYATLDEAHREQAAIEKKYRIQGVIRQRTGWKKW